MEMDVRKQQVLLAVILDYTSTAEPVGSRTISRKYNLGVSPATIRNEMSDLEELGFIEQPHTSAGRIPSQKGYRYYVDFLMEKKHLSDMEEELIRKEYEKKVVDVGNVINRTCLLLSQMTNFAAIILTPSVDVSLFKHIQLLLMSPDQVIAIVVMNTGAVKHNIIEVPEGMTQVDLDTIASVFNAKLKGLNMDNIKMTLIKEIYFELSKHKNILDVAMQIIQESLSLSRNEKIYFGGMFNILNQPEFHNIEKVKTILSLLEQEELIRKLMEDNAVNDGINVRIGSELNQQEMKDCSVVLSTYHLDNTPVGKMGVLGPTRMDYAWVVSVVETMTSNLSDAMGKMLKGWR